MNTKCELGINVMGQVGFKDDEVLKQCSDKYSDLTFIKQPFGSWCIQGEWDVIDEMIHYLHDGFVGLDVTRYILTLRLETEA